MYSYTKGRVFVNLNICWLNVISLSSQEVGRHPRHALHVFPVLVQSGVSRKERSFRWRHVELREFKIYVQHQVGHRELGGCL